jgi:hypothetical protein
MHAAKAWAKRALRLLDSGPMHIGPLYEQAMQLTPEAARIAALLLVGDDNMPPALRRSLCIALSACTASEGNAPALLAAGDPDAVSAQRFVADCLAVARGIAGDGRR